jgi:hypothetical protein
MMMLAASLVLPLLAALALPAVSLAGPPEEPSGTMVFVDKVAEGLRQYHREADAEKRIEWLNKLAPTRDPRVGVVLGELQERWHAAPYRAPPDPGAAAITLLRAHYLPGADYKQVLGWWKRNEADLRRRAKRLPQ